MTSKKIFEIKPMLRARCIFYAQKFVPTTNAPNGIYRKSSGLETIFRKNVVFAVISDTQRGTANKKGRTACGLRRRKRGTRPRFQW
jgi:hypothetical protein